jgi:hypothetical protein
MQINNPSWASPFTVAEAIFMTTSRIAWTGTILALAALLPLDCRQAVPPKASPTPENSAQSSNEPRAREVAEAEKEATPKESGDSPDAPRAREVSDVDVNALGEKSTEPASKPIEPPWQTAARTEMERHLRERRDRARADWHIALRTDSATIVPCQPFYVTIMVSNTTDQPRKLRELLDGSEIWILVGRNGEQPRAVQKDSDGEEKNLLTIKYETVVAGRASVLFDRMLTTERVDGSTYNNSAPNRIFSEPGEYNVYAAVVGYPANFEVLRSEPLVITVREPVESEVEYVEFFREGRQIPPHYGFSKVDEEAFDKLRDLGRPERIERMVAFNRKVDAETIGKLRAMLAKHPDLLVADDMRYYLMVLLKRSAKQYDEKGRDQGRDRDVVADAAEQYLAIAPERKQLRRRGIKTWWYTSGQFNLDEARPIVQIVASWRASSPFYEDEVDSQAALDEIIAKIEAPLAQQARQRAAAPPPKPKPPPTD